MVSFVVSISFCCSYLFILTFFFFYIFFSVLGRSCDNVTIIRFTRSASLHQAYLQRVKENEKKKKNERHIINDFINWNSLYIYGACSKSAEERHNNNNKIGFFIFFIFFLHNIHNCLWESHTFGIHEITNTFFLWCLCLLKKKWAIMLYRRQFFLKNKLNVM